MPPRRGNRTTTFRKPSPTPRRRRRRARLRDARRRERGGLRKAVARDDDESVRGTQRKDHHLPSRSTETRRGAVTPRPASRAPAATTAADMYRRSSRVVSFAVPERSFADQCAAPAAGASEVVSASRAEEVSSGDARARSSPRGAAALGRPNRRRRGPRGSLAGARAVRTVAIPRTRDDGQKSQVGDTASRPFIRFLRFEIAHSRRSWKSSRHSKFENSDPPTTPTTATRRRALRTRLTCRTIQVDARVSPRLSRQLLPRRR